MKVAYIICGLQTYSSMYPYTWCDVKCKCLAKSENSRTLGSIKSSLESFQESDGVVANAKLFDNVIQKAIISGSENVLLYGNHPTERIASPLRSCQSPFQDP